MARRVHVVGLGVEVGGCLNTEAEAALSGAEVIIGAKRQLDWLRETCGTEIDLPETRTLPKLAELTPLIDGFAGEVVVLASGDPLYFGIGRWLSQQYPASKLRFYSAVSSVQAACSRLGMALQDCTVISLHGRSLASLNRYLQAGRKLIILTDQYSHPEALAEACIAVGLDHSVLSVCEKLGYEDEQVRRFDVANLDDLAAADFSDLHVSVLELHGESAIIPQFPGIDDRSLATDGEAGQGMITKREVRIQVLSLLQVGVSDIVWDVGAGCGGVATELSLWHPDSKIIAIEQNAERLDCLRVNRDRFGCVNLEAVDGRAPAALADLPDPQRIFIGGSDGELDALLDLCWQRLAADGVMVISAVTEATEQRLDAFVADHPEIEADSLRLAVTRNERVEGQWQQTRKRPVTLLRLRKTEHPA